MKGVKHYMQKLTRGIFHRTDAFALEGGISFGPGSDPKGSFYSRPRLEIYWNQPGDTADMQQPNSTKGLFTGWLTRLMNLV